MEPIAVGASRPPIRGWLLVFVAVQFLELSGHLLGCSRYSAITAASGITPAYVFAIQLELIHLAWMIVIAVGLWRIQRRHRRTRRYWLIALVISVPVVLYQFVLGYQLAELLGTATLDASVARGTAWRLLLALVWIGYWARSMRVRQTFTSPAAGPSVSLSPAI